MTFAKLNITVIQESDFEKMVNFVLDEAPDSFILDLMQTPEEKVAGRHHMSAGQTIRNHFHLWQNQHTPVIEDGVDVSPDHPDSISSAVLIVARQRLLDKAEATEV